MTAFFMASICDGSVRTRSWARSRTSPSSPYSRSSSAASNEGMRVIVRNDPGVQHQVLELAQRIRVARRVTVMTGAGVSTASGVPPFRGPGGLWRTYRPEDLATHEAFARDPVLV